MIGARIREIRLARGMTLEGLAAEIGSNNAGQISKIENGKAQPSMKRLRSIADALGVPVSALTAEGDSGLREPEVAYLPPKTCGDNSEVLDFTRLAPGVLRPMNFQLMREAFGWPSGTILVLDQDDAGRDGDLVLVQLEDRTHGFAETRLARRLGGYLVGASFASNATDFLRYRPDEHLIKGRIAATAWAPQIAARSQICA